VAAQDRRSEIVVVPPGGGDMLGNVEFLARSADTPHFNLSIITVAPRRHGPALHSHDGEADAFYILDGELTMHTEDSEFPAPAGTFVLVPPHVQHTFSNATGEPVRVLNVHAPAGFDLRIGLSPSDR